MGNNPIVSIAIPVYNGSNYLAEAIESALAQTYSPTEILVVNDGSSDSDSIREIACRYGDRIRYFEKQNGGVASALNLAIQNMRGDWFSWLSHDDLFLPDKVKKQVDFLFQKKADIIYGDYELIDENGNRLPKKTEVISLAAKGNMFFQLLNGFPINGCTTLINRKVFDQIGLFNPDLPTTQDYDFWFRCAKEYEFHLIPEILIKSRIHPEQDTCKSLVRHYECDELYTKMARFIVQESGHRNITQKQLMSCGKFLVKYNYLSAVFMLQRGLQASLRARLLFHVFLKISFKWLTRN
ncbi:MAG TPA: glycosyltransferase [Bacteroidales bacterium]|nr:glycosyltransferase [Bacteroidales bacterium]